MLGPQIEIPRRPHMQRIPGAAGQGRAAVAVAAQHKLPAVWRKMANEFGIGRRFNNVECELFRWHELNHAFLKHGVAAENAAAIGIDKRTGCGGGYGIGQAEPEQPKAGWRGNLWKGCYERPDLCGWRMN